MKCSGNYVWRVGVFDCTQRLALQKDLPGSEIPRRTGISDSNMPPPFRKRNVARIKTPVREFPSRCHKDDYEM